MATKKPTDRDEPTQKTPEGYEIPIPSKEAVFGDLEKVAKPPKRRPVMIGRRRRRRIAEGIFRYRRGEWIPVSRHLVDSRARQPDPGRPHPHQE